MVSDKKIPRSIRHNSDGIKNIFVLLQNLITYLYLISIRLIFSQNKLNWMKSIQFKKSSNSKKMKEISNSIQIGKMPLSEVKKKNCKFEKV